MRLTCCIGKTKIYALHICLVLLKVLGAQGEEEHDVEDLQEAGQGGAGGAWEPLLDEGVQDQADHIIAHQADHSPRQLLRQGHICGKADVAVLQHPAYQKGDAVAHALEGVVGHLGPVHDQLARLVIVRRIRLEGRIDSHRDTKTDARQHHQHVLFRMAGQPLHQMGCAPHHQEACRHAHHHILRRVHAQVDPAEGNQHHDQHQHDAERFGEFPAQGAAAEHRGAVHGMAAGEGISGRSGHGVPVGEDAGIPDPGAVGAHRHLQRAVHQPVAAPAHEQIGAQLLADAPVDQGHDHDGRIQFSKEGHLDEEIAQDAARLASEFLQCQ